MARAHALRGFVLIVPHHAPCESLPHEVRVGEVVRRIAEQQRVHLGILVRFEGIADRTAAEALRGLPVKCERDALPAPLPGEVYAADLAGFAVFDRAGKQLGSVVTLESGAAQDLLRIELGGREVLVPYVPPIIFSVDPVSRRMVIDPPEGLLEL